MVETKIILSGTWVVVMLIYLLGDVLRIMSGDLAIMMTETKFSQNTWFIAAVLMLFPILMVFLTLVLPAPQNRWANVIVAGFFFVFNLIGLPGYPSMYDKFLLVVSMVFNGVTIWYAWKWIY